MTTTSNVAGVATDAATGRVRVAFARIGGKPDHQGDVILPGAIPSGKDVGISGYNHGTSIGETMPVGRGTLSEQGGFAVLDGFFFTNTAGGRETFETIRGMKELQEWSFGFRILASRPVKAGHRELVSLDIFEVSPVLRGAGLDTHTISLASLDPLQLQLARWARDNHRELLKLKRPDLRQELAREHARFLGARV